MKRIFHIALLGGALLLAACSASSPELINYRGGDLEGVIEVKRSVVELAPGGLPQARAILVNDAGTMQRFEYKFVWFDASDMPVDEEERSWHAASLAGKDEMTVRGTAPHDKARRFQIQIREPQGVTR